MLMWDAFWGREAPGEEHERCWGKSTRGEAKEDRPGLGSVGIETLKEALTEPGTTDRVKSRTGQPDATFCGRSFFMR